MMAAISLVLPALPELQAFQKWVLGQQLAPKYPPAPGVRSEHSGNIVTAIISFQGDTRLSDYPAEVLLRHPARAQVPVFLYRSLGKSRSFRQYDLAPSAMLHQAFGPSG